MATHSSVLAWRMPGTGEPGGLPSSQGKGEEGEGWLGSLGLLDANCYIENE